MTMSYKTILAILRSQDDCEQVLDTAVQLTRQFDAHLIGFNAEAAVRIAYAAPIEIPDATAFKIDQQESKEKMEAIHALFSARCEREDISGEWRTVHSSSGDSAISALPSARCADLVVVRQQHPEKLNDYADLDALVLESGRPVLFVPYIGRETRPIKHAIIAWNGTRQSARAAFDAMPFLMRADTVEIFCVDPEDNAEQTPAMAGAELAATLTRHGINVTAHTEQTDGLAPASAIENRLSDTGADLLVMGAYSRSRLREYLFGGVTRTIFQSMTNLTLMSS